MNLRDTLSALENVNKANWKDENNWSSVKTLGGGKGLRISLQKMSEEDRDACRRGLIALGIPFHEKYATAVSRDEKNIETGDLCIRVLDPKGLDKLSTVFGQTRQENATRERQKSSSENSSSNKDDWVDRLHGFYDAQRENKEDAWIDGFWADYDTQRKNKEVEYISPWTAFISGLSSKKQMSDEQAMKMFSKAFNRAKDSSFVDPKGNSLKASEWTDASKNSLLIIMLQHGRNNIAERLIQLYSNVRHSNENGLTPLHAAAATGSIKMCEQLISRGADPLAKIKDTGDYPYQIAEIHGHKKVSEYLLREAKEKHFSQVAHQAGSVNR